MSKVIIESRKWYQEAIDLVRNFDFALDTVYDNTRESSPKVQNCQFCGQSIRYVAIISGQPMQMKVETPIKKHIGCDCLGRVLGEDWKYYGSAMNQHKKLVDAAKVESRKEKYANQYAEYIKWIEALPEFVKNQFLKNVYVVLTTGSKVFSDKMEKFFLWHKNNPKYNGQEVLTNYNKIADYKERCKKIIQLIESVDGAHIHSNYSSFNFVNSVMNSIDRQNGLTPSQMKALNNVYTRYTEKKNPTTVKVADPNKIVADMTDTSIPY